MKLDKIAKLRFVPPFGLRGNVHGSSMARWKACGRLPISANWTFFASCHGLGAMSKYWSKLCCLKGGWVILSANFRGRGSSTNKFWRQKTLSPWAITWCCLRDPTFSRFDTILECDTQTDTQWWLLPAYRLRHAGKNSPFDTKLLLTIFIHRLRSASTTLWLFVVTRFYVTTLK